MKQECSSPKEAAREMDILLHAAEAPPATMAILDVAMALAATANM